MLAPLRNKAFHTLNSLFVMKNPSKELITSLLFVIILFIFVLC